MEQTFLELSRTDVFKSLSVDADTSKAVHELTISSISFTRVAGSKHSIGARTSEGLAGRQETMHLRLYTEGYRYGCDRGNNGLFRLLSSSVCVPSCTASNVVIAGVSFESFGRLQRSKELNRPKSGDMVIQFEWC
jgi:hypothetical protein